VEYSKKLLPFRSLLQYIVGKRAFLVFALFWLGELDGGKGPSLVKLLSGNTPVGSSYSVCFDFARGSIASLDIDGFREECRERVRELLIEEKSPLVLKVVGTHYRPCVGELSSCIASAQEEAFRRAVLDGEPEQEARQRIRAYLESIEVLLMPEPYNSYDRNAVGVLLRFPNGRLEQAGYVKREIAAILAPLIAEGVALSGRISELGLCDAEVQVRAG